MKYQGLQNIMSAPLEEGEVLELCAAVIPQQGPMYPRSNKSQGRLLTYQDKKLANQTFQILKKDNYHLLNPTKNSKSSNKVRLSFGVLHEVKQRKTRYMGLKYFFFCTKTFELSWL